MPTITFYRSVAFRRGDLSIALHLNGKKAGVLTGTDSLSVELPAGTHKIQAFSNGLRGRRHTITVGHEENRSYQIQAPRFPKGHWWEVPAFLLFCLMPEARVFGAYGLFIQVALYAVLLSLIMIPTFREMRKVLSIESIPVSQAGGVVPG